MYCSRYDRIAPEYYNPQHVTSRNFDRATSAAIKNYPVQLPGGLVLEIGAGRGRAGEFLELPPARIVQLDSSQEMFELDEREECLMMVNADACSIPLVSEQFSAVVGFLVDPFLGLQSLGEAYRMLSSGGRLFLTTPTRLWGTKLRQQLEIDTMTTRFRIFASDETITLPSYLYSTDRLREMLEVSGFCEIEIHDHCLAPGEDAVSPDIISVCEEQNVDCFELPIIHSIRARR